MYSTPSSPATPAPRKRITRATPSYRRESSRQRRRSVRDSVYGDSWACWPNYKRKKQTSSSITSHTATGTKKMAGFSLYPVPPTPPPRKHKFDQNFYQHSPQTPSPKAYKIAELGYFDQQKALPLLGDMPSDLVPAPLKVRKTRTDEASSTSSGQSSPQKNTSPTSLRHCSARDGTYPAGTSRKRFSQGRSTSLPIRRSESKVSRFRTRPLLRSHRHQRSASTQDGLNQWFDIEEGMVDRKRLSTYLGSVLGSSFQVSLLDQIPDVPSEPVTLENVYPIASKSGPLRLNPPSSYRIPSPSTSLPCECSPGRILCQDKSSPEFKIFKRWPVLRKTQFSVSSTACRMHVARAQLDDSPAKPRTPPLREIALGSSPPELLYDTPGDKEDLDWSVLRSSPREPDVFMSSPPRVAPSANFMRHSRKTACCDAYLPMSTAGNLQTPSSSRPVQQSRVRQISLETDQSSHSSCSSFDFDFDFDSVRHFQQAPSHPPRLISSRILQRRFRQPPEPIPIPVARGPSSPQLLDGVSGMNIATVARSMPIKPTLVTHRRPQASSRTNVGQTIESSKDGLVEYSTRVQIRQPYRDSHLPKTTETHFRARALELRPRRNNQWNLAFVPEHGRTVSRVTSDGSPVLGQPRFSTLR